MVFKFRLHLELSLELGEMFHMRSLSALGQKQTWRSEVVMSAFWGKADIPVALSDRGFRVGCRNSIRDSCAESKDQKNCPADYVTVH
jgi:hypothetical protein